jgi:cell wall-associated NlpC family hydrolase
MLSFLLLAMAGAGSSPPGNAVITEPVANMYSRPTREADVVSQAIFSTNVAIIEEQPGWLHVRTPDAYTGWIASGSAAVRPPYAESGRVARVENLFASLYRETDITRHEPVMTVPFEARVEITSGPIGPDDRWLEVRLPDNRTAWLQSGDVSFDTRPQSIAEVIEFSRRFLGLPYLWGGTSTFGYDCSGFTQMLCRRRGTVIPRDADLQAAWNGVEPVALDALQPGDLLYFGSRPDHITHTGMYIGGGQFINATPHQHPVIQICPLDDPHWKHLLVAARRLK